MKQEYIPYWQNTLQHSQKLEFYRSFKTDHTSSSYLDLTRGTAGRRALVKLQISNHKLMIEIGRYNQTTKDNRHCPFYGCDVIEDEVHFLFQCPTYSMIRNKFCTIRYLVFEAVGMYGLLRKAQFYQLPLHVEHV